MTRRTLAGCLLSAALWFWALPLFFPVASRAVVNARTVQMRAPVGGEITELAAGLGDPVAAGEPVVRIRGRNVDHTHLAAARAKQTEQAARHARLATELAQTAAAAATCEGDLERYKKALANTLGETCREGRVRVAVAELECQAAARRFGRYRDLVKSQAVGVFEHDDSRDAASVAKARIELERASLGRSEMELKAVDEGLFVTREVPIFQTQARELAFKLPRLRADLAESEKLLEAAARAVRDEERRVHDLTDAAVPAPAAGVVWKRTGGLSQLVERNELVLDVADGSSVFEEALVHQRYVGSVGPGCRATVCLTGGQALTGRVRSVRTPNPAEPEPGLAVALADPDPRLMKVAIDLDGRPPAADMIGRHARVLITDAEPSFVERGVDWLFARLRF